MHWAPVKLGMLASARCLVGAARIAAAAPTARAFHHPALAPAPLRRLAMGQAASLFTRGKHSKPHAKKSAAFDRPEEADPDLWLLVGLGNPGPRYEDTRHNVGFMLIDTLARAEAIAVDRLQENAAVGRGRFCGKKVLLAKPMTFMNNSGESVGRLARFYRVPAERIIVVYDDLDLPSATVRLRAKGGHGGHNGMKSITSHLQGSKDFPRIRIGIGRPEGQMPIPTYVLQDFTKAERVEIDIAVQEGIDLMKAVLTLGLEKAVSGVRHDAPPKPKQPRPPRQPKQQKGQAAAATAGGAGAAAAQGEQQPEQPAAATAAAAAAQEGQPKQQQQPVSTAG